MADRYCILPQGERGAWDDPAVWSATENGSGGATPPVASADDAIFNASAEIDCGNPLDFGFSGNVSVRNRADVGLTFQASRHSIMGRLDVDGSFSVRGINNVFWSRGVVMENGAKIMIDGTGGYGGAPPLLCIRMLFSAGTDCTINVAGGSIRLNPGVTLTRIPAVRYVGELFLYTDPHYTGGATSLTFEEAVYEIDALVLCGRCLANGARGGDIHVHGGSAVLRLGSLSFYRGNLGYEAAFYPEDAEITVLGDISHVYPGNSGAFTLGPGRAWRLAGTQDQFVDMPGEFDSRASLEIDKTGGTAHLTRFRGDVHHVRGSLHAAEASRIRCV